MSPRLDPQGSVRALAQRLHVGLDKLDTQYAMFLTSFLREVLAALRMQADQRTTLPITGAESEAATEVEAFEAAVESLPDGAKENITSSSLRGESLTRDFHRLGWNAAQAAPAEPIEVPAVDRTIEAKAARYDWLVNGTKMRQGKVRENYGYRLIDREANLHCLLQFVYFCSRAELEATIDAEIAKG